MLLIHQLVSINYPQISTVDFFTLTDGGHHLTEPVSDLVQQEHNLQHSNLTKINAPLFFRKRNDFKNCSILNQFIVTQLYSSKNL